MKLLFLLSLIGLLAIGAIYFTRLLMKEKPYHWQYGISAAILGLLLAMSMGNSDENLIVELEEKSADLAAVNTDLMSQLEDSQKAVANYESELQEANEKLAPLQKKLDSNSKEYDTLVDKSNEKDSLIKDLEKAVATLEENVESLETELTAANETAAVAASTSVSDTTTVTATADTGAGRKFQNCTDLRTVHPDGVSSDHADYQPSMDRDKDGWACER